jgi:hypothetical protein
MTRQFRYIFYRIYIWDLKYSEDRGMSAWKAVLGISFLSLFVLLGMFSLVVAMVDPSLAKITPKTFSGWLVPGLVWIAVHHFALVQRGRLDRSEEEFGRETAEQRRRGTKMFAVTVVLALVLPYAAMLGSHSIAAVFHP